MRNPIAKNIVKFNRPSAVAPKRGKGSFKRTKRVDINS